MAVAMVMAALLWGQSIIDALELKRFIMPQNATSTVIRPGRYGEAVDQLIWTKHDTVRQQSQERGEGHDSRNHQDEDTSQKA